MPDEIAESLIEEEKYEEAAARLESLLEDHEDPGLRLRLATCCFRAGKLGDALANARRSAEQESEHRADAVMLVAFCLRSLKRYREAAKTYLAYAEEYGREERERARLARFSAALCLEELDDWSGAAKLYREIDDDESLFRLGICLEKSGKPEEAYEVFERFLQRFTDSPERLKVRFRLGALRLRQGRFEEAISHLEEAVRLGEGTFLGEMAEQLLTRARAKSIDTTRKLQRYQ
ncbi:MAG: tetratricopeptide repeat protein [Candidatus Hydrogenedentota bacterium]|nr:MAG: tetratricopeptide repeat protein [Candidatus Hydrogenedentota bacterium]